MRTMNVIIVVVVVVVAAAAVVVVVRVSTPGATPRPLVFWRFCGRKCWYLQHFFSVVIESGNCSWFRVYFLHFFEHCSSISHPKMLVFTALVLLNFLIFCCFLKSRFSCPKPTDQNEGFFGLILIIMFIQIVGKESIHVQNLMTSMV